MKKKDIFQDLMSSAGGQEPEGEPRPAESPEDKTPPSEAEPASRPDSVLPPKRSRSADPLKGLKPKSRRATTKRGKSTPKSPLLDEAVIAKTTAALQAQVQDAVEKAVLDAIEKAKTDLDQVVRQALKGSGVQSPKTGLTTPGLETRPHAFVIMPFGKKTGFDGTVMDFNAIYQELIKPALEQAGFEPFRADEETASGDILTDMFQELLLADLAICDLSIDNANVFYELGIRHAFRKRGVVHIQSGRAYMPFDIFNVRTIPYHTGDDGKPDPEYLEKDIQTIARVCRDTWASDQEAIHSPVFNLLTGLDEPDRKALRTPLATGFWREYDEWEQRVTVAQRQKRVGDIMLLTEEIRNPLIKEDAISKAGQALSSMNRHELALRQYRQGLELNPQNVYFRRQEAYHLSKLGRLDDAIVKLENLLQEYPDDTIATTYLGRIYMQMWVGSWEGIEDPEQRLQEAYNANHWLIKSIHIYLKGYYNNLNDHYPGISALSLAMVLDYLARKFEDADDPDILAIQALIPDLRGTLTLLLAQRSQDENATYWVVVSYAELMVLTAEDIKVVRRAFKKALIAARKNIFVIKISIEQLEMLRSMELRPEFVETGLQVLRDGVRRIQREASGDEFISEDDEQGTEQNVFLFKGHQIDSSKGSGLRRFPEEMVTEARERIDAALSKFNADGNDLALAAGASNGGDIIFIEACLDRGMKVEVLLPKSESEYVQEYISPAGDEWVERYYNLRNHPNVLLRLQEEHLGKVRDGDDPDKRNNRRALYSALVQSIDRVRLIALWDGQKEPDRDAQLVSHMVDEMRRLGGYVEHINTQKFDYWQAGGKVGRALDNLAGL